LGVLAEAKNRAFIPACKPLFDQMMEVAGFWIGEILYRPIPAPPFFESIPLSLR
jgi:predicted nucleic acid-binding protein